MTLDRVLSRFGLASRTAAREAILAGQVKVNGRVVRDPDRWTDPRELHNGEKSPRQGRNNSVFRPFRAFFRNLTL